MLRRPGRKEKLFFWSAFVAFIPAGFLILKSSLREAFLQGCFLLAFSCSFGFRASNSALCFWWRQKREKPVWAYHAVSRAQPVSQRLPVPQQQFLHFDIPEGPFSRLLRQFGLP